MRSGLHTPLDVAVAICDWYCPLVHCIVLVEEEVMVEDKVVVLLLVEVVVLELVFVAFKVRTRENNEAPNILCPVDDGKLHITSPQKTKKRAFIFGCRGE